MYALKTAFPFLKIGPLRTISQISLLRVLSLIKHDSNEDTLKIRQFIIIHLNSLVSLPQFKQISLHLNATLWSACIVDYI